MSFVDVCRAISFEKCEGADRKLCRRGSDVIMLWPCLGHHAKRHLSCSPVTVSTASAIFLGRCRDAGALGSQV